MLLAKKGIANAGKMWYTLRRHGAIARANKLSVKNAGVL